METNVQGEPMIRNEAESVEPLGLAEQLRSQMSKGVLGFPLTAFTPDGLGVDLDGFSTHLQRHLDNGVAGLFVACGTGEFSALNLAEYRSVLMASAEVAKGKIPVIAGVGYGWSLAREFASVAEDVGVDGILLMPHYLVEAPQQGLISHVERVAEAVSLPIILYQRGLVHYTETSLRHIQKISNVIGLKDGNSDFVSLQRMTLSSPKEFLFFNGSLTAEIQYRPYAAAGVVPYSSSVASCSPEIARAFFNATVNQDDDLINRLLLEFYGPLVDLRDSVNGYAVSLIKAAARLRGEKVGPVRAPLADPTGADLEQLEKIVRRGLAIVGAEF